MKIRLPNGPNGRLAGFRTLLALAIGLALVSCNLAAPSESTPPSATTPASTPLPAATPDLSLYLPVAGPLCDALVSSEPINADPATIPSLILVKKVYDDRPSWQLADWQLPYQESWLSTKAFMLCIEQSRTEVGSYTDGEPGYEIAWDAWLLDESEPQPAARQSPTMRGGVPFVLKRDAGPEYGDPPLIDLGHWLDGELDIAAVFYADSPILDVACPADGRVLAIGYSQGAANLWDAGTEQMVSRYDAGSMFLVRTAALSPDGTLAAFAWPVQEILLWNTATGERFSLGGALEDITALAFSPDGKALLSGEINGRILLWNTATGRQLLTLSAGENYPVAGVAFSPDGKLLATSTLRGGITIWDAATGQEVKRIATETPTNGLAFSPTGDILASSDGTGYGVLDLWEVAGGRKLDSVRMDWISAMAFSPDGRTLAVAGTPLNETRPTILLRDVATEAALRPIEGSAGGAARLVFSPDGKTLIAGSADGTVRRWEMGEEPSPGW